MIRYQIAHQVATVMTSKFRALLAEHVTPRDETQLTSWLLTVGSTHAEHPGGSL